MLDYLTAFVLVFSHDTILIPLIVLGYIWLDRAIFYHATCLLLLSMLVNPALKVTFKVPLLPHLGGGYAFPSGHMQSATVFYGWIAYKTPCWMVRTMILALLIGIGFGLVHLGFHRVEDIAAAVFVGIALIALYCWVKRLCGNKCSVLLIAIATALLFYIQAKGHQITDTNWLAYFALIGFILSSHFNPSYSYASDQTKRMQQKLLATAICLGSVFLIRYGFQQLTIHAPQLPNTIIEAQWLAIGYIIPFSITLSLKWIRSGR